MTNVGHGAVSMIPSLQHVATVGHGIIGMIPGL